MELYLTCLIEKQNETSRETLFPRMVQPALSRGQNLRVEPSAVQGRARSILPQPARLDTRIAQRHARHNGYFARPDQCRIYVL